jgi:hypothetical protein
MATANFTTKPPMLDEELFNDKLYKACIHAATWSNGGGAQNEAESGMIKSCNTREWGIR